MSTGALNSSQPLQNDMIMLTKLAENAAKVAYRNFEWQYVTMVVLNSAMFIGIDAFIKSYRKSVILIGKGAFLSDVEISRNRIRQFVVFGTDLMNIKHILDWMRLRKFDNTGKYIFICEGCEETEAIDIFWNHKITNVVLLKNISCSHDVLGITYFPYDDENCKIGRPVMLQDPCHNKSCLKMFPMKLENFHSCQVIVSTFIWTPYMSLSSGKPKGIDGDLLVLIGEALNASLKMMTPHDGHGWGTLIADGDWTGSLGDVYHDLANFSMTSALITMTKLKTFQISTHYRSASMVWVTHPAVPLPAWQKILRPFQMPARIILTVTLLFIVVVACCLKSNLWIKLNKIIGYKTTRSSFVFYAWTICMGMPTTTLPSKPAFLYMFLLFVIFCFIMRTFYQAALIHALKDDLYFPEFEDLDDILSSGYPLGGGVSFREYFSNEPKVLQNWVEKRSSDIIPTLFKLSKGMQFVLAISVTKAKLFMMERKGIVHIIPQKIVCYPTVLFFKKFSPIEEPISKIILRLTESGFTEKLYKNHIDTTDSTKVEENVPLNMSHYIGCYVVLAMGWVLSALSFVLEIVYYKFIEIYGNIWCSRK